MRTDRGSRTVTAAVLIMLGILQLITNTAAGQQAEKWLWLAGLLTATGSFAWSYYVERRWWTALGAYGMASLAVLLVIFTQFALSGIQYAIFPLLLVALPFFYLWLRNMRQWGWLIPGYLLVAITGLLMIAGGDPRWIAVYTMGVLGLPFMLAAIISHRVVYILPGGLLWCIGLLVYLILVGVDQMLVDALVALLLISSGLFIFRMPDREENEPHFKAEG